VVVVGAACKAALSETGNHQIQAAKVIGISRGYFFFPKSPVLLANLTCEPGAATAAAAVLSFFGFRTSLLLFA
tara:strand:- start:550 stop:768 length:219 start_codon:yes stop_codon:yes gene_type:complete